MKRLTITLTDDQAKNLAAASEFTRLLPEELGAVAVNALAGHIRRNKTLRTPVIFAERVDATENGSRVAVAYPPDLQAKWFRTIHVSPAESLTERQISIIVARAKAAGQSPELFLALEIDRTIAAMCTKEPRKKRRAA